MFRFLFRVIYSLISLFTATKRDVSRREDADLDELAETVDLSVKPLKPNHHRLTVRDRRLLPKKVRRDVLSGKRKQYFSESDARRLFSASMRNRNPQIRDLLSDEQQLQRYQLPLWKGEDDLAEALGVSVGQLRHFSIHREKERADHYIRYAVPKRSGGERIIMAPKKRLKAIQKRLHDQLISKLPVSEHSHGFVKGRSIRSGAQAHVAKKVVIHLDLKDFFPSVTFARVRGFLIAMGYAYPIATTLAIVMTEADRQPVAIDDDVFHVPIGQRYCVQGAPTSPGICNAIALRLDRRLAGLASSLGFSYSRYADDMTFSGNDDNHIKKLLSLARRIIKEEGFQVNENKTRIMRQCQSQMVTGVTVNKDLGLSRRERRKIRAMIHQQQQSPSQENPSLKGKLAYLKMLNESQFQRLRDFQDKLGNS